MTGLPKWSMWVTFAAKGSKAQQPAQFLQARGRLFEPGTAHRTNPLLLGGYAEPRRAGPDIAPFEVKRECGPGRATLVFIALR
jgi:hypothetical protein